MELNRTFKSTSSKPEILGNDLTLGSKTDGGNTSHHGGVDLSMEKTNTKYKIQNSNSIPNTPPIPIPIESLHHLSPDLNLNQWFKKGIRTIQNILLNDKPKPFTLLQQEFSLPQTDLFTYMRVAHCLRDSHLRVYTVHPKAFEHLTSSTPKHKGISLFYNIMHHKLQFTKKPPHIHWEHDLGQTYTEHQWQKALQPIYKSTKCTTLWETTQKLHLRWYLTPSRLTKFNPSTCDQCWRCCSAKGDLLHIFWTCPRLRKYCNTIFQILSDVLHQDLHPTPDLAVLNLTIESVPPPYRHIGTHILLAARLCIARL